MFLALGELTGKRLTRTDLTRGLRTDGLGTLIGGVFNTFPYTSFSQNVGLVGITGVRSRWVRAAAASFCSRSDCSRKWLTWLRRFHSSCWAARAS